MTATGTVQVSSPSAGRSSATYRAPRGANAGAAPAEGIDTIQIPRRFTLDEWGGTETTVLQTSRALNDAGHRARIFTSLALSARREEQIEGVDVRHWIYDSNTPTDYTGQRGVHY